MDTPRPDQIRAAQPEAQVASEDDAMELMEMILGALGEMGTQQGRVEQGLCWGGEQALEARRATPMRRATRHWQAATHWAWAAASHTRGRAASGGA